MFRFSSVQSLNCVRLSVTPWTAARQASLSITQRSNSCPSSQWCYPTISSSVVPFSTCSQSFPASGSFQMSQLFAAGGQSIGVSASKTKYIKYSKIQYNYSRIGNYRYPARRKWGATRNHTTLGQWLTTLKMHMPSGFCCIYINEFHHPYILCIPLYIFFCM